MTIDAYKTLYESSVTFGVRKQLEAEQGMDDLEKQVCARVCVRVCMCKCSGGWWDASSLSVCLSIYLPVCVFVCVRALCVAL